MLGFNFESRTLAQYFFLSNVGYTGRPTSCKDPTSPVDVRRFSLNPKAQPQPREHQTLSRALHHVAGRQGWKVDPSIDKDTDADQI